MIKEGVLLQLNWVEFTNYLCHFMMEDPACTSLLLVIIGITCKVMYSIYFNIL